MTKPYETLSSRVAYANKWTRVREDRIRHADGSPGLYGVVERADFVVVVPWQDAQLTLVEQFRYPVQARIWEFPMGMWEQRPEADPRDLAAGELREETGLVAGRMTYAGAIFQGPGYCVQRGHIFLATDLIQGEHAREVSEQDMICRTFPLETFETMVREGTICESMTLSAFALLRAKGLL